MNRIPKRLLLAGAAPLAIAAIYGGSIAFAQSGEDSTQPPAPTGGAAPQTPAPEGTAPGDGSGCDHKGGARSSDSQNSDSGTSTQIRTRARIGAARLY